MNQDSFQARDLENKPEEAHHFKIIIGFKGDGAVIQTMCAGVKGVFGRQIVIFVAHFYGKMLGQSGNFPLELSLIPIYITITCGAPCLFSS